MSSKFPNTALKNQHLFSEPSRDVPQNGSIQGSDLLGWHSRGHDDLRKRLYDGEKLHLNEHNEFDLRNNQLPPEIRADSRRFAVSVLQSELSAIERLSQALQDPDAAILDQSQQNESISRDTDSNLSQTKSEYVSKCDDSLLAKQFDRAVETILNCRGNLILCGIGKAGWIAQKLSATFASTGTPSHFLHPSEAIHGDLGRLTENDVLLVLSHSGQTYEITRILPALEVQTGGIMSITADPDSTLAAQSNIPMIIPRMDEACENGLAPSTSTTVMLALGDALALTVSRLRGFTKQDFARFHPGGSLGMQLAQVDEVMRPLSECRVGQVSQTISQTLIEASRPGRRTGAIMLVDDDDRLRGIFTDSDLARLLEKQSENSLNRPVQSVMTQKFRAVHSGAQLVDAVAVLTELKISELPVIDKDDRPLGMIDITDVMSLVNHSKSENKSRHEKRIGQAEPTIIRLFSPDQQ